jgi:carbon storage regulator CsrA
MLVLSRKVKEKIVFPTINTAVQVVEVRRGVVRLGIEAPPEITVLREEVADRSATWRPVKDCPEARPEDEVEQDQFKHQLQDRLKTTAVNLGLVRLQLDAGLLKEATVTLARLQDDFQLLRYGLEGELEKQPVKPPVNTRKPRKALLVEDNRDERELLARLLRQAGLEVATTGDGADALDYLGSHGKPDVILLDMGLPRVDGPTVVRQLRCDPAFVGLKIFGVTGHLPDEFDLERGPRGIDRWFQKPLDTNLLLHDLTEELDGTACGV